MDARIAETMAEYDAIEDAPTVVRAVTDNRQSVAIYNLQGQRLDTLQRGINIIGGKKHSYRTCSDAIPVTTSSLF